MGAVVTPLSTADYAAARAIFNHWISTSTAVFHEAPITADEFAAMVSYGDQRHGAFAIRAAATAGAEGDGAPTERRPASGGATDPTATDPTATDPTATDPTATDPTAAHPTATGPLAGFALVSPFKSRCAYRDTAEVSIYLRPDDTGRGLGRAALDHLERHARAHGLHALLAVVCAENTASLAAFGRGGYAEVGRLREVGWKFGRRLDVVYLERLLDQ